MTITPRVVIGVPLYNHARYLPETLESLLSQSFRSVAFVLVDDCSTDETAAIVSRYLRIDARLSYERNARRLGMVQNWRRAFEVGRQRYPGAEYFAWGSDHDLWHPRWLETLVSELDRSPAAVLAYPRNLRISESGEVLKRPWSFETRGVHGVFARLRLACADMKAGDMVYALYRADTLARAGVFRPVLLPDRLLLAELSLYGEFVQSPEILWYRRFRGLASKERQRAAFFPDGPPRYSYLPWWLTHAAVLAWSLGGRERGAPQIGRPAGLALAVEYLWRSVVHELTRRSQRRGKRLRKDFDREVVGRARRTVRPFVRRARQSRALVEARLGRA